MSASPTARVASISLAALLLAVVPASAGTISIAWDPVTDADLSTYQIFWGTSPGRYSSRWDRGLATSATLGGLSDCTRYYVALKARDASGNVSPSFSDEISGYPRPVLSAVTPADAFQGTRVALEITGVNFLEGASVRFGNPDIVVHSVTVSSCRHITAIVTVGGAAATGPSSIEVVNPDRTFASGAELFTVRVAEAPTVIGISPASLATGVPIGVRPTVIFSQPMDPGSVDAATVALVDGAGSAVPQLAGSPFLSSDGRIATLVPASSLGYRKLHHLRVQGGESGVRDTAGRPLAATFVDPGGFTTEADSTPPVLSAVSATADATTAEIAWTTDEPADGEVLYRKHVDSTYRQWVADALPSSRHSIGLQGLAPSTTYVFRVRSADADGNRSSSEDGAFATGPSPHAYLALEPESGTLYAPVRASLDAEAFRGAGIEVPSDAEPGSSTAPAGRADLSFHLPADGTWYLWMRLRAPSAAGAWTESVDGAPPRSIAPSGTDSWTWTPCPSYSLSRGLHVLSLGGLAAGARADRVLLTDDPAFVPSEMPGDDTIPPEPPGDLTATTGGDGADLGWMNPASDVSQVVVRYRTDGRYPSGPEDGVPALARAASPSAAESFIHSPLVPGTTYSYGVFVVDPSGNASDPATFQVTLPIPEVPGVTLFSTSQNQFLPGVGTLRNEAVYGVVDSGVRMVVEPFVPANLGLDGFHFEDPAHLVFKLAASGGVQHGGGFTFLKRNNVYRLDLVTRAVTLAYDFDGRGVFALEAFDVLGDGRLAFSTETTVVVGAGDGASLTLRPKNVYVVDPATGGIEPLADGEALGLRDLDAIDVRPDGTIVLSTSSDQVTRTGISLRHQNAYAWDLATGEVRLELDGRALGLYTLDAIDVEAPLPAATPPQYEGIADPGTGGGEAP
jgi:hypothetical protein